MSIFFLHWSVIRNNSARDENALDHNAIPGTYSQQAGQNLIQNQGLNTAQKPKLKNSSFFLLKPKKLVALL